MSSIVISGDTSGSITLASPAVAGSNTITLPASTGTVLTTGSPQSGGVIQVVNAISTTQYSTSSSSYTSTGFTVSITPKFATSKILLLSRIPYRCNANANPYGGTSWYRGGSPISVTGSYEYGAGISAGNQDIRGVDAIMVLDNPATVSSVTYTMYFVCNGGSGSFSINDGAAFTTSVTLMEIAA